MAETFSWAAGADVGLGLMQGLAKWSATNDANSVAEANAEAANIIRESQNKLRAANTGLYTTIRGINEKRLFDNAGRQYNAIATTMGRTQDANSQGNFERSIRDSEQLGAIAAGAAASGVGGSALQALSYSSTLQKGRVDNRVREQQGQVNYDQALQLAGVIPAAASQRNFSPLSGGQDYSTNVANTQNNSLITKLAAGLFSKADSANVFINSFRGDESGATSSIGSGTTFPVSQSTIQSQDLLPLVSQPVLSNVQSFPVNQSQVNGTPLGSL